MEFSDDRGQGSIEYLGVMVVLAGVLVVASIPLLAPSYLNGTVGAIKKALCTVTGRECRSLDRRPCVIRARDDERTYTANLAVVRLADGRLVRQERLSDGRIRVTVSAQDRVGGEVAIGAQAGVDYAGVTFDASLEATAVLQGLFGRGKVYDVADAGAAQRLLRTIGDDKARSPDVTFHEGGLRLDAEATAGATAAIGLPPDGTQEPDPKTKGSEPSGKGQEAARDGPATEPLAEASVSASAIAERALGHRKDHRTGETTWYLRADQQVGVDAGISGLGHDVAAASAAATVRGLLTLTTTRDGRPVEIGAVAAYRGQASYSAAGAEGEAGGHRHEVEVRADPDDPLILAALRAWRARPADATALADLTRAVYANGRIERRTYEVEEDGSGASGSLALGLKVGGGYEERSESAELVAASARPPGGQWEQRVDCLVM